MHHMRYTFILLLLTGSGFSCASPEEYFKDQIQEPVYLPYNSEVERVKAAGDPMKTESSIVNGDVPAQDEIVLQEEQGRAFISSMDGWIWKLNLKDKTAEQYVKSPLLPAGMAQHPKNPDIIFFCVSRGKIQNQDPDNDPGIYELTISTRKIRKIGTRVPFADKSLKPADGQIGITLANSAQKKIPFAQMNSSNSRVVEKADDHAVSLDGERIYFTEPYDHANAILGVSAQSRNEILTLGRNGHLWMYDLKNGTASLVAYKYAYLDGLLLEYANGGEKETSIIVDELSKSRLLRLYLSGPKAGSDEITIEGIPGLPDGIDRDDKGRIWMALVAERSRLVTWLHAHPSWKRLMLYLPERLIPLSKKTGIVAVSPDGKTPLYYTMHDGDLFSFVVAVIPGKDRIYLVVYKDGLKGLRTIPYPEGLR
ncbi:MAG: hypothetical protein K8S54_17565 [Spirochaetia bacterium]|nr:hypothetical protein [Spirochaetia bacterium]